MEYKISINELIDRDLIRKDFDWEWMNKMTDSEYREFYEQSKELCLLEGCSDNYPHINACILSTL